MTSLRALQRKEDRFEDLLSKLEFAATETELTPEKRAARLAATTPDTPAAELAFCKTYFPEVFALPFNAIHEHLATLAEGSHTVSGFRRGGKSAYAFIGKVIRHVCLGRGGLVGVNLRTLDKAVARTRLLSRMIQANRLLAYDFEIEVEQDAGGYHILGPKGARATHLIAGSYATGLRAYVDERFSRFQLTVNDDLYDRQSIDSERDNEKVTNFVLSEVRGQMEDDGLDITLGNSISAGCPIVRLKEERPEAHFSLPALSHETGETTWPAYRTTEEWHAFRDETPYDIWLGEYQDRPAQRGDVFQPEWLRTVRLSLTTITASITAVDPSHGESPAACYKGVATVGMTDKREAVCLDLFIRRAGYEVVFDYLLRVRRRFSAHHKVVLFENDFNQWGFAMPYYQAWKASRKELIPFVMHNSKDSKTQYRGADKESRILNLVHPHQTGGFAYAEEATGSADWEEYKRQFLGFGKAREKLDGLDALATAYIKIGHYVTTGTFKPLKKRTRERPSWGGGFH